LIRLKSGIRISEPVLARMDDLVLDHDIQHLWERKNSLIDRKTQASIRCVPAAGCVARGSARTVPPRGQAKSEWLMPQDSSEIGNTPCAARLKKYMGHLDFRTPKFRRT